MTIVDDLREHCEIFTMVDVGNVRLLFAELDRLRAENEKLRADLANANVLEDTLQHRIDELEQERERLRGLL